MRLFLLASALFLFLSRAAFSETAEEIYLLRCAMCHQPTGQGAPPIYPPLAQSDWLAKNRAGAIKAVCEGLSGEVTVNGVAYHNVMPAQMLDDQQVADVLTYVLSSWGNRGEPVTAGEVAKVRSTTRFPTFAALQKAGAYAPLPAAADGWTLREVAQLPEFCTRLAGGGKGEVYVLAQNGTVYLLNRAGSSVVPIIQAGDYLAPARGALSVSGLARDAEGRLWIVSNQRITSTVPYQNEVAIYRTSEMAGGVPAKPKLWFSTQYPYGIGSFNHGVSHLAFGPDGLLYVASGSRTDGGEAGRDDHYYKGGEVDLTACLWRFDPKAEKPKLEVFARGLRNPYGFTWDGAGRLWLVDNGPDASAPEEVNLIEPGQHFGFPFQFSDWPVKPGSPYAHTPPAPADVKFTLPVVNSGPAAGAGLATFDPHSSPAGMIWCGDEFAAPLRGGFVVTRFGNLLGPPAAPKDVGFDLLLMKPRSDRSGKWLANCETLLGPLGRPLDVIAGGDGSVLILEYTRPTNFREQLAWLPGRVLELKPK